MAYTTIDDPSAHFQTALYTGDGASSNAITNGGNSDLQPDWLWIKNRSSSGGTGPNIIFDSTRGPPKDLHPNTNEAVTKLPPNLDSAEDSSTGNNDIDMLSNGFKVREDNNDMNESGQNFIYMAFAESPFVSSEGVPTTAR